MKKTYMASAKKSSRKHTGSFDNVTQIIKDFSCILSKYGIEIILETTAENMEFQDVKFRDVICPVGKRCGIVVCFEGRYVFPGRPDQKLPVKPAFCYNDEDEFLEGFFSSFSGAEFYDFGYVNGQYMCVCFRFPEFSSIDELKMKLDLGWKFRFESPDF